MKRQYKKYASTMSLVGDVYKTYKFYSKNGQRLAIFGIQTGATVMDIHVIKCSEKDQFDRNVANMAFFLDFVDPTAAKKVCTIKVERISNVPITANKPKKSFLEFCKLNYCVMKERKRVAVTPVLVDHTNFIVKTYNKRTKIMPRKPDNHLL